MRTHILSRYRPAFGMTALVLGHIALLLFFLPVLGIPLSVCGLAFGLFGVVLAFFTPESSLRWGVAGLGVCVLALIINAALYWAPGGYKPPPRVPATWQPATTTPFVAPPARRI